MADTEERVRAVSEDIGLQDAVDQLSGVLSHGKKQWLEIDMLLAQDPRLLLVDEPAASISLTEREQTTDILVRAAKTRAVMVAEHDIELVRRLNCKVKVLHQRSILAKGSLDHNTENRGVVDVCLR